uniref:hypothetical protein n=1 Tax=Flavobacterium sp. TaxID=239 RepID=UPI00404AE871
MKTTFLKSLAIVALSLSIGCSSDDDNGPVVANLEGDVLQGNITEDLNIPAGNYFLRGAVTVSNEAELTIQPGVTFTVSIADQAAGTNYLLIEQGAKIFAKGTATSPIVFTSESATIGSWGGLILNGKAKINAVGGTEIAEAGGKVYGGQDDNDSSGSLKYVRVEYAGAAVTGGTAEYNAFSFFGLGTGTVLENLQAYKGADDGFEFFGGKVNATNLAAFGCEDDSIDWDKGYSGTLTNVWVKQPSNGDWGFETSNHPTEFDNSPRSNPTVNNVTVEGSGNIAKAAFLFKEGTAGTINNVKVSNIGFAVRVNTTLDQYNDNSLNVNNVSATVLDALVKNGVDETNIDDIVTESAIATGANEAAFSSTWVRFN